MKKVLATLIVLASVNTMAATFKVCKMTEAGEDTTQCRIVTNSRQLGVPSNAAEQQCTGEGQPCEVKKHSNGYVPVLSAINAWFESKGATPPPYPGYEAP
jgi:hypothetical protein